MASHTYQYLWFLTVLAPATAGAQQALSTAGAQTAQYSVMEPVVSQETLSREVVRDVHLRPLFTTTFRLPDAVSSVDIGAPTLFEAEHSDQEPRLVYVKPATKQPAESNLIVTLRSGETITWRLISAGSAASPGVIDFLVDYEPQQSFFVGATDGTERDTPQLCRRNTSIHWTGH